MKKRRPGCLTNGRRSLAENRRLGRARCLPRQTGHAADSRDLRCPGHPPETLARVLEGQPDWQAQEGNRLPCLQLFPVEANAGARLQRVLDNAAQRAKTRVNQMMTYAEGRRCRHAELAAHLGERLSLAASPAMSAPAN